MKTKYLFIAITLALVSGGCVAKRPPIKIPGPIRVAGYGTAQDIIRAGGHCVSGTGGYTCTDAKGDTWYCQVGYACVKMSDDN